MKMAKERCARGTGSKFVPHQNYGRGGQESAGSGYGDCGRLPSVVRVRAMTIKMNHFSDRKQEEKQEEDAAQWNYVCMYASNATV